MTKARAVAAFGALVGAAGLSIQLVLQFRGMSGEGASAPEIVWRYLGYFTILTNVLITAIMARAALKPESRAGLNAPLIEAMGLTGILLVGIVYHLLLASQWDPQGVQLVADVLMHSVTPVVMAVFWLLRPHGRLSYRDAAICMVWPLAYAVYALARGAADGWYAYWFFDPTQASWGQIALTTAAIIGAFFIGALAVVALDKVLARRSA